MALFPTTDSADPAGHGKRIAAALLDAVFYVLVVGGFGTAGFVIGLVGGTDSSSDSDGWEELGWILLGSVVGLMIGFVVWVVLTVWLVRRPAPRNGQTLGKQIVGIRVTRADGAHVSTGIALVREIFAKWVLIWIVSSLISALLGFIDGGSIGLLVAFAIWYGPAFADDRRRALHDRICSTRVVDAGPGSAPPSAPAGDELWPATTP